ncbi:class I SAM-dependent methyltransferase [Nocardioides sp.]|uniref:class I SAM-dependent methyltransferase n=1 Tax=Nocardioides sp. TaxID=35761 RepID=UPI00272655EA|nr:class I SAM-dependent methyltransferase [Nocardioides sp.]MDO9454514.1 class I SAM-dependent methyltransferase [Nocardioides sp.]
MDRDAIASIRGAHREPGFGTMSVEDLVSIEGLIAAHRPASFLEIGTASGLSAAVIAHMLEEHGGERLTTVDLLDHFYADPSREAGFVIPLAYPDGKVAVERRTGWTAADVVAAGATYDMALVDGGHVHPWPLIDTLCVNVVLTGPRLVLQDDLTLFRRQPNGRGVGPKFLFDQFPESHREVFTSGGGNLFAVSLDLPPERIERIALDAFALPWTLTRKIPEDVVDKVQGVLDEHYSATLSQAFATCCATFNKPNGQYFRPRKSS